MKIIKSIGVLVLGAFISIHSLSAQSAVDFVNINPDAHTMAMANTGSVMYATPFAIWNNSSSVVYSEQKCDFAASYGVWQPGSSANNNIAVAGYGNITNNLAITAGVKYFTHQTYNLTDEAGTIIGDFTPKELSAGVGVAYKISKQFSAAVNFNYIMSDLGGTKTAGAFAGDIGLNYQTKAINVGLTASNLGTKVNYGGETAYSLPANVKLGVGKTCELGEKQTLTANIQAGMTFEQSAFFAGIGAEYAFDDMIFVRTGYHYGDKAKTIPSYASVGLGAKFCGVAVNVAYLISGASSPINNSFNVSLGWGF